MSRSSYESFQTVFSISFFTLISFTIWGGIVCVIWEPQQASTGWVAELPNVGAIYFDDISSTPGQLETRTELRHPTTALRNSYLVFFFLNAILGGVSELFYFLNFDRTFVCIVIIWAVIGLINTGAVGAVNSKFLKDFLTDLGMREGETLKLMKMDLMFQLHTLRTHSSNLTETVNQVEEILNATIDDGTILRSRDLITNILIISPEAEVIEGLKQEIVEVKKKEAAIVNDLKIIAAKIGTLKYLKSCYSQRACALTRHYTCIYYISIVACLMHTIIFFWACQTVCCGIPDPDEDQPDKNNDNIGHDNTSDNSLSPHVSNLHEFQPPVKRNVARIPSNKPAGDSSLGFRTGVNNNPLPGSGSSVYVSASPSLI